MASSLTARWALTVSVVALCVSVATCLLVILFIIHNERELSSRDLDHGAEMAHVRSVAEGDHAAVIALQADAAALKADLAALKNWAIAIYERADAHGWRLPQPPKEAGKR